MPNIYLARSLKTIPPAALVPGNIFILPDGQAYAYIEVETGDEGLGELVTAFVVLGTTIASRLFAGRAARAQEESMRDAWKNEAFIALDQIWHAVLTSPVPVNPGEARLVAQQVVVKYYSAVANFTQNSVTQSAENFRQYFTERVDRIVKSAEDSQRRAAPPAGGVANTNNTSAGSNSTQGADAPSAMPQWLVPALVIGAVIVLRKRRG